MRTLLVVVCVAGCTHENPASAPDADSSGADLAGVAPGADLAGPSPGGPDEGADFDVPDLTADATRGPMCTHGSDCASKVCINGSCAAPTCNDMFQNGSETDVDCGGPCPACALGKLCAMASDCASQICAGGRCAPPPSCTDGLQNENETDVDCGGASCGKCAAGKRCAQNSDCLSGGCVGGLCKRYAVSSIAGGTYYGSVVTADFDGDGRLDLAVADQLIGGTVQIWLGSASTPGAFTVGASVPLPSGTGPIDVTAADYNIDGRTDLVISYTGNSSTGVAYYGIQIMLGSGSGSFTPVAGGPFTVPGAITNVAVGDLDGNGKPDLVFGDNSTANGPLTVYYQLGSPSLFTKASYGGFAGPEWVVIADFNGDGRPDVAATQTNKMLAVTLSQGGAPSTLLGPPTSYPVVGGAQALAADFNGDGKLDVAVASFSGNGVSILLGNGNGTLQPAMNHPYATGAAPGSVCAADVDLDGKIDLVTGDNGSIDASWLRNLGAGAFAAPVSLGLPSDPPYGIATGDFNRDGRPDFVLAGNSSSAPFFTSSGLSIYLSLP